MKYEVNVDGLYENIYIIRDICTGKEWIFLDLDLEDLSELPMSMSQSVHSICDLLNEQDKKIEELEQILEEYL